MGLTPRIAGSRRRGGSQPRWGLLVFPAALFMFFFFAWPLGQMIFRSFTDPATGLDNYARFAQTPSGVRSLLETLAMSAAVTLICAVVGYVYAYAIRFAERSRCKSSCATPASSTSSSCGFTSSAST